MKVPLYTEGGAKSSRYSVILDPNGGNLEVGNVSENYQLVPNEAVHEIALDVLTRTGMNFEDAGMIFDGRRYRQCWTIPDLAVEPVPNDIVQLALHVVNSYDGSTTFGLTFNANRLVCTNGMMIDFFLGGFKFRHYGHDDFQKELEEASAAVLGLAGQLEPLTQKLQHLVETPIDRVSIQAAFKVLSLPQSLMAQVFMQIEEDTLWGFYNACTCVLSGQNTHRADNINRQVSRFLLTARS